MVMLSNMSGVRGPSSSAPTAPNQSFNFETIDIGGDFNRPDPWLADLQPSNYSMTQGLEFQSQSNPPPDIAPQQSAQNRDQYVTEQKAITGARFFADVLNAQSRYNQVSNDAQINIYNAQRQGSDARMRGREAALMAESQGSRAAEDALLSMVAQGQDAGGAGTQRVTRSQEAMGMFNAMKIELNAMREVLGFKQDEIMYQGQVDQARIARNYSVLGSGLQAGAQYYALS